MERPDKRSERPPAMTDACFFFTGDLTERSTQFVTLEIRVVAKAVLAIDGDGVRHALEQRPKTIAGARHAPAFDAKRLLDVDGSGHVDQCRKNLMQIA